MSKRHKHRHRPDLREVMEDFERDWQAERDAALEDAALEERTADNVQPILKVVQAEAPARDETLKELELAKTRVTELEARCRKRWPTWSLVLWLIVTAATFGGVGYIARLLTE